MVIQALMTVFVSSCLLYLSKVSGFREGLERYLFSCQASVILGMRWCGIVRFRVRGLALSSIII